MTTPRPVFDYATTEPWSVLIETYGGAAALDAAIQEALDAGQSHGEAWDGLWDEEVRRLRTDPAFRARLREHYAEAGVNLLCVTTLANDPSVPEAVGQRREFGRWQARFDAVDWLSKVTTPSEARRVVERGDVGVVLNTQNLGAAIQGDVDEVDALYDLGLRVYQLTYNRQNLLGTGCNDPAEGGLSTLGRAVVDRLCELGAVVDLSHCGRRTTLDAVAYADGPVAYTHASCRAVADHFRGKSDEELEALADEDGYVGIVGLPFFLAPDEPNPPLSAFFDHLDHAVSILGPERVGIGTDFFPADAEFPRELVSYHERLAIERGFDPEDVERRNMGTGFGAFETYADFDVLADGLAERYSDEEVRGILGENFLRFWERVVE